MGDTFGKASWDEAMKIELKFEGGKDDDPRDPGGRTNQGVIQRVYSAWRIKQGLPAQDVFLMTDAERDAIYWQNYGRLVRYDELPPGVNIVVLDGGVNSGPSQSIKWLQRALGLTADGVLGDVTLQATINCDDHDLLIAKILEQRMKFLQALKTFKYFGRGWTSRVNQLRRIGQSWAMGSIGPSVVWESNMNKKANQIDAKPKLSTAPADATAAGGTVMTGITTAQNTIQPLQGSSAVLDQILIALMVIAALATVFGFVYAWYVRRHNSEIDDALSALPIPAANDNDQVPMDVLVQYADPMARGGETGNIAPGTVTTSGRTAGDTDVRLNPPSPVPVEKRSAA